MEPEKLKELILNFYTEIGKNFGNGPSGLSLPPKIFEVFLKACPEIMGGDGNAVSWNLPFGSMYIRRG